jgi:hypothetical protein
MAFRHGSAILQGSAVTLHEGPNVLLAQVGATKTNVLGAVVVGLNRASFFSLVETSHDTYTPVMTFVVIGTGTAVTARVVFTIAIIAGTEPADSGVVRSWPVVCPTVLIAAGFAGMPVVGCPTAAMDPTFTGCFDAVSCAVLTWPVVLPFSEAVTGTGAVPPTVIAAPVDVAVRVVVNTPPVLVWTGRKVDVVAKQVSREKSLYWIELPMNVVASVAVGNGIDVDIGTAVVVVEVCIGVPVVAGIGAVLEAGMGTAVDVGVKTVVAKQESTVNSRYWIGIPIRVGAVVEGSVVADGRTVVTKQLSSVKSLYSIVLPRKVGTEVEVAVATVVA